MNESPVPPANNLEAALAYLHEGWSIVPLHEAPGGVCSCGKHVWPQDNSAGKHPRIEWTDYQQRRATAEELRRWWTTWPTANIGGLLGAVSGRVCIESDSEEKTRWVREVCGGEPQTEMHQAARGPHYIFSAGPEEIPSCRVGPGIEVKAGGTLIVLPPSVHPSGHVYTSNGVAPAPLPPALLDAIRERGGSTLRPMTRAELHVAYTAIPRGEQHNALASLIGRYIRKGYDRDDIEEMALMVGRQYDPPADPEHVVKMIESLYETDKRNHPKQEPGHGEPVLIPLADVQARRAEYLSASRLLRSELNLLGGPTGAGKSYLSLDCAARLTSGRNLFNVGVPGWTGNLPGRILYMSREDDEGIIRDRFDRLGGDPTKFLLFPSKTTQGRESIISLASDIPIIERALRDRAPDLLVIDNLAGFLGTRVDARRMNEVRPILDELVAASVDTRTAVLMIVHLNKRESVNVLERIAESAEFIYRPRSILFLAEDPDDPTRGRRVLTHEKNSYGPLGEALALTITDDGLSWEGATEKTSQELLTPERERSAPSKLEEAVEFLRSALASGPRAAEEVTRAAWRAHIADRTLDRARLKLRVEAYPHPKPGPGSQWFWRLPDGNRAPVMEVL